MAQRWNLQNYVSFVNRNTPKDFHYVMGFILKVITGMRLSNFHLEASVSVFGDQQDLLIFGHKCRAEYEGYVT